MNVQVTQVITNEYAIYNGDSCTILTQFKPETVGLSIHSPPFAQPTGGALYHYSSSPRDLSNAVSLPQFMRHYAFMVREMYRLTMPGRIACVHVMDVPSGNTGCDSLYDFQGDLIRLYEPIGFRLAARIAIFKEPLAVRNRTMAKALAHKTIVVDSSHAMQAGSDYLLVFRKNGKNPVPIAHPNGFSEYAGERQIPADLLRYRNWKGNQIENRYSHWIWRNYASAIWDDIRLDRVLPFREARDEEDEKHCHPLQLDVIDRCVDLWSNPGDIVLTPCMGVGSEIYGAVRKGRRGLGVELKPSYFRQAIRNLDEARRESLALVKQPELFAPESAEPDPFDDADPFAE